MKVTPGWHCPVVNSVSRCGPLCGDGIIIEHEQCDDNNTVANDGCFNCLVEEGW